MAFDWELICSDCPRTGLPDGLPTVCPDCGQPWLVQYHRTPAPTLRATLASRPATMWRYREWLPLLNGEEPVTLGEGMTPLIRVPSVERALGVERVWIKDEAQNPTGSFKARGMAAAISKARELGVERVIIPTAGNTARVAIPAVPITAPTVASPPPRLFTYNGSRKNDVKFRKKKKFARVMRRKTPLGMRSFMKVGTGIDDGGGVAGRGLRVQGDRVRGSEGLCPTIRTVGAITEGC